MNEGHYSYVQTYHTVTDGGIPLSKYKSAATGITVCIAQSEGPLVSGYLCIATEAKDDDGLPHTLEHLVFMGSEKYPYKGVLDMLANRCLASGTNAWTDTDHTCYTMATAGCEGFLKLLPIYLDHLLYPLLTDAAFVTEIHHVNGEGEDGGVVYSEMQGRENTAESICHLAMLRTMYPGDCGYRHETGGLMKNLRESTTNEKVRAYHKEFYRPQNLCIIIVGQIDAKDVFQAIETVEQRILKDEPQKPFVKPWQDPVPPLDSSATVEMEYPCGEDESGMAIAAWRGPESKEYSNLISIEVLMQYLTDTSISPFQRDLVESTDPYCNQVDFTVIENSVSCIYVHLANIPLDKLKRIGKKIMSILEKIANGTEEIDMKRMAAVIHKKKLNILTQMESSPHDQLAMSLIGDFLYGSTLDDLKQRVQQVPIIESLFQRDAEFWKDMIKTYMINEKFIIVLGRPSPQLAESMENEEKKRLEDQQKRLGREGLKKHGELFEQSVKKNEIPPPSDVLSCINVPSVNSIKFHSIARCTNASESVSRPAFGFALDRMPCQFQLDVVKSNFIRVVVLLDTSDVPQSLRMLLPLYVELLTESSIRRNGEIIPYHEVIKQLDDDTISTSATIGFNYARFSCNTFSQVVRLNMMIEEEQYAKGVEWIHGILFKIVFDKARIKTIVNKMVADVASLKRSGVFITKTMIKNICFCPESNQWSTSMMRQHHFLTELLKTLASEPDKVISELNELREAITKVDRITVHLALNLPNVRGKNIPIEDPWMKGFLPSHLQPAKAKCLPKACYDLLDQSCKLPREIIIGVGSVETSFLLITAPMFTSFKHPDYPALLVTIQYFTQVEGPLYKYIRGNGLAYGYNIFPRPNEGLMYFMLYKATHLVGSYHMANKTVENYLSGHVPWDTALIEAACSSLIFELIETEKTISNVIEESICSYYKNVDMQFTRTLLDKIMKINLEDMEKVGVKYLRPLFDPESSKVSICCHPAKVNSMVNGFKQFSRNLNVISSLDDPMFSQY